MKFTYNDVCKDDSKIFSNKFVEIFKKLYTDEFKDIVLMCMGTDRATGDCLAPLVGYKLEKRDLLYNDLKVKVLGTLSNPVHAANYVETIDKINCEYNNPFVIAIDACLGKTQNIGLINIVEGSIKGGSGVGKDLPPVGSMSITGVVNFSGFMDMMILQNTRLNIVMEMADTITDGLISSFEILNKSQDTIGEKVINLFRNKKQKKLIYN